MNGNKKRTYNKSHIIYNPKEKTESDDPMVIDSATIIAQQLDVIRQGKALVEACNDYLTKASTETESFNQAVVTMDEKTKEKVKSVYDDIIKDIKQQVDSYAELRIELTEKHLNAKCSELEGKVNGLFMHSSTYYAFWFLTFVSLVFGLWGCFHFFAEGMMECMRWFIVIAIVFDVLIWLLWKVKDM